MNYISAQLGTAQLGLAQLGQFKKPNTAISLDASARAPQPVTATPLVSGGRVSGGTPLSAARFISAQLGTAQLGLAQLGQYEKQFPLGVNASLLPPLAVVATALTNGEISGGDPVIQIAGGALKTPGIPSKPVAGGFWWWWAPSDLARRMIERNLDDGAK